MSRSSRQLQTCLAREDEVQDELLGALSRTETQDPERIERFLNNNGAIILRLTEEEDDEGHHFIEFSVLCTSIGDGPFAVTVVGKRWNVDMTE